MKINQRRPDRVIISRSHTAMNQKHLFCEACFPNTPANFIDIFTISATIEYLRSDSVDAIFCSDEHDAERTSLFLGGCLGKALQVELTRMAVRSQLRSWSCWSKAPPTTGPVTSLIKPGTDYT